MVDLEPMVGSPQADESLHIKLVSPQLLPHLCTSFPKPPQPQCRHSQCIPFKREYYSTNVLPMKAAPKDSSDFKKIIGWSAFSTAS